MTYREILNLCEEKRFFAAQALIAEEMECQLRDVFELQYTPERFEELCSLAWEIYLKAEDVTILQICRAIARLENAYVKNDKQGNSPTELTKWDILNTAVLE